MKIIQPKKLTAEAFRPFGSVILKPERALDIESPFLRYWHDMIDLSNLGAMGTMGFMQMKRVPILCETLQVLHNSIELYLSLDGKPSIFFAAPPRDGSPGLPDEERIEAFLIEGSAGLSVDKGIWHVAPFPLTETADFVLGLRNNVILRAGTGFTVDAREITYAKLAQPVKIGGP
ncbi:MAG: ureidoglycolate lyase [Spirochaetia bacterium]